ncbi:MAG: glycerol-3-phosphate 1-O-acyltransferase PlsY [Phycisphaerales bacterium]
MTTWALLMIFAALCGSIPTGYLLGRIKGVDIRTHGSGNIGATNVGRVFGLRYGVLCLILDVLKGLVPALAAGFVQGLVPATIMARPLHPTNGWLWLSVVCLAVLGHMYSPWVSFRGGKGVATGLGAMLGVFPYLTMPAIGALALWGVVALLWRYVSAASCLAALSLTVWVYVWARISGLGGPARAGMTPFFVATAVMGLWVIYRHRSNIRRLLAGKEARLGQRIRV